MSHETQLQLLIKENETLLSNLPERNARFDSVIDRASALYLKRRHSITHRVINYISLKRDELYLALAGIVRQVSSIC